jgi:hypothetical protein
VAVALILDVGGAVVVDSPTLAVTGSVVSVSLDGGDGGGGGVVARDGTVCVGQVNVETDGDVVESTVGVGVVIRGRGEARLLVAGRLVGGAVSWS